MLLVDLPVKADYALHLRGGVGFDGLGGLLVGAGTWVFVIELFQFHLTESLFFRTEWWVHSRDLLCIK